MAASQENNNNDVELDDELFEHYRFDVDPGQSLLRIDKFLMDKIPNATRNKIQNGIRDGFVTVNGESIKPNYKVRPKDVILISLPEPPRNEEVVPEDLPLNIVYEDDDLLVVNKAPGMVVHPAYNNWSGTLVNGLMHHVKKDLPGTESGGVRPGLVHRIDKDTSGLLVVAKTELAMTSLAKQFFDHSAERTYYAIVWSCPKETEGTINAHVGRSLKNRKVMQVFPQGEFGKHAITHYKVLEDLDYVALIQCNLETGRTHQIRAHMKYLGHPLFNDTEYGGDVIRKGEVYTKYKQFVANTFNTLPRQALHAKTLGFKHPRTQQWMQFDSELPEDFQAGLDRWRDYIAQRKLS